jgi:toxin HigB-1
MILVNSTVLIDYFNGTVNWQVEKLKGDLEGYNSIRINEQYRIIFQFDQSNTYEVEIIDYHK